MRLIDADKIEFHGLNNRVCPDLSAQDVIDEQPTIDAVSVVRCRECENYGKIGDCQSLDLRICIHSDTINHDFFPDPDFFCAYGQRKEAGHEQ